MGRLYDQMKRDWEGFRIPKGKTGRRLPIALSQREVEALCGAIKNLKHRAILMTIYSAGLRVSEALHLKPSDICTGAHPFPTHTGHPNALSIE